MDISLTSLFIELISTTPILLTAAVFVVYGCIWAAAPAVRRFRNPPLSEEHRKLVDDVVEELGLEYDYVVGLGSASDEPAAVSSERLDRTLAVRLPVLDADRTQLTAAIAHAEAMRQHRVSVHICIITALAVSGMLWVFVGIYMAFTPVGTVTWFARAVVGLGLTFLSFFWSRYAASKTVQAREAVKEIASPAAFEALWDRPDLHRCFYDEVADSNRYRKLALGFDDEYAIPTATPGQEEHSQGQ